MTKTHWLVSANPAQYDVSAAFDELEHVDWHQSAKFEVGDILFIYVSKPVQRIQFMTQVIQRDIEAQDTIDDQVYWKENSNFETFKKQKYARLALVVKFDTDLLSLNKLLENGLKFPPRGPQRLKDSLLTYIEAKVESVALQNQDTDLESPLLYEGAAHQILSTRYERNRYARMKCLETHGYQCKVCDILLEDIYGELGKEFIHVHHIIPVHMKKKQYQLNPIKDLVPVCPNCHAMLHRKIEDKYLTVEELRLQINKENLL